MKYDDFLSQKRQLGNNHGFKPKFIPEFLFPFQQSLVDWSINKGRSAIFADCGMGKTPMQLVWSENVVRHTNGNVLIIAPLAVSAQTVLEANKFDIECYKSRDGKPHGKITITNYEQLHHFDHNDFVGVVCDESSILKSFKGALRQDITRFMRKVPYRLLATATPSPNDFIELGTSSEALSYMGAMDMMNKFFKNDQNNSKVGQFRGKKVEWRLKGHAELPFWRWVCSWARALRKPSDLGFDDTDFILPELIVNETMINASRCVEGQFFAMPAMDLHEQRKERRSTIQERCEDVANKVNNTGQPALVWCHLNDEGDLLEKMIPDAIQVSGKDSPDRQEEKLLSFSSGKSRILITKPQIGAWGLNFQHCNHMTFFPSHSFEQYYQSVRRCWRFGQTRPVTVDIITTEGEGRVMKNLQRKSDQADNMFARLVSEMNNATQIEKRADFNTQEVLPSWL
jgi:hypothetical protein